MGFMNKISAPFNKSGKNVKAADPMSAPDVLGYGAAPIEFKPSDPILPISTEPAAVDGPAAEGAATACSHSASASPAARERRTRFTALACCRRCNDVDFRIGSPAPPLSSGGDAPTPGVGAADGVTRPGLGRHCSTDVTASAACACSADEAAPLHHLDVSAPLGAGRARRWRAEAADAPAPRARCSPLNAPRAECGRGGDERRQRRRVQAAQEAVQRDR